MKFSFSNFLNSVILTEYYGCNDIAPKPEHIDQIKSFVGWGALRKHMVGAKPTCILYCHNRFFGGHCSIKNVQVRPVYSHQQIPTAEGVLQYLIKHSSFTMTEIVPSLLWAILLHDEDKELNLNVGNVEINMEVLLDSYYTPTFVSQGLWHIITNSGFDGGMALEPCAGNGSIVSAMPKNLAEKTHWHILEPERCSYKMCNVIFRDQGVTVFNNNFEQFKSGGYDLVVTNVPFGPNAPTDKSISIRCSKHDYFIIKSMMMLRIGGIGVFITSASTMDKITITTRKSLVEDYGCDLIAAIRLPAGTFVGTEVTTDILVLKKRDTAHSTAESWLNTVVVTQEVTDLHVNEYYINNPQNIIGYMQLASDVKKGGLYKGDAQVCYLPNMVELPSLFAKVLEQLPKYFYSSIGKNNVVVKAVPKSQHKACSLGLTNNKYLYYVDRDLNYYPENELPMMVDLFGVQISNENSNNLLFDLTPIKYTKSQEDALIIIKVYCTAKQLFFDLVKEEQQGAADDINVGNEKRDKLNKIYDKLESLEGINTGSFAYPKNAVLKVLQKYDVEYPIVASLQTLITKEIVLKNGAVRNERIANRAPILKHRVNYPIVLPTTATDLDDALSISLSIKGSINTSYIASLLGIDEVSAIEQMLSRGIAFECPKSNLLIPAEEYLSGNIHRKLFDAENAGDKYAANVAALRAMLPRTIPFESIIFSLRSRWIPIEIITNFLRNHLEIRCKITYNLATDRYEYDKIVDSVSNYDTRRVKSSRLVIDFMNMTNTTVYDTINKQRVRNDAESQLAIQRQIEINDAFIEWLRNASEYHEELECIYNAEKNAFVVAKPSIPKGKFIGMSLNFEPYEHQRIAVQRFLRCGSGICWHPVGSGKTRTMIALSMESIRLGLAKKVMVNVQNSTIEQWVTDAKLCYPQARILYPSMMGIIDSKLSRNMFMLSAMTGDWDIIVVPGSYMDMMPDKPERLKAFYLQKIAALSSVLEDIEMSGGNTNSINKEIEKWENMYNEASILTQVKSALSVKNRIEKQFDRKKDNVIYFEDLGVDMLLVDEVHRYKRGGITTKMQGVKGIDTSSSKRALSMLLKLRHVQEKNGGRNTVGFSGTIISNTMAELWTMINLFRPDILRDYNVQEFDRFASDFGNVVADYEMSAGGTYKIVDRFAQFVNMPELLTMVHSCMDIVTNGNITEYATNNYLPKLHDDKGMHRVVIQPSEQLKSTINGFKLKLLAWSRLTGIDKAKQRHVPLVIFGEAKKAAISMALITGNEEDCYGEGSKTFHCIKNCLSIYKQFNEYKGTQLIFCDSYQYMVDGKVMFSLYKYIASQLQVFGVPSSEIAIINETKYKKDGEKEKLFQDVNDGKIRFVIGGTETLGTGVNVQTRCAAIHHLDIPSRPSDYEQRLGRMVRKGNIFAHLGIRVYNYVYVIDGSLDTTAAGRIKTKAKFIDQIMNGSFLGRVTDDAADTQTSFAEIQAALMGEYGQQKFMIETQIKKLRLTRDGIAMQHKANCTHKDICDASISNLQLQLPTALAIYERIEKAMPSGIIGSISIDDNVITSDFEEALIKTLRSNADTIHWNDSKSEEHSVIVTIAGDFDILCTTKYIGHIVKRNRRNDRKTGMALDIDYSQYRTECEFTNFTPIGVKQTKFKTLTGKGLYNLIETILVNQSSLYRRWVALLEEKKREQQILTVAISNAPDKIKELDLSIQELKQQMEEVDIKLSKSQTIEEN